MVGKYTGLSDSYLSVLKVTLLFISSAQIQFRMKCVDLIFFPPPVRLFCMRQLLWAGNSWWTGFLPAILKIQQKKR